MRQGMTRIKQALSCLLLLKLDAKGQATVEYLVVGLALMAMILALGTIAGRLQEGILIKHAIDSASHAFGPNMMGTIGDVLLF